MNTSGVSPHLLRAFVYIFKGEAEKTQVRQPPLLHAARISKFSHARRTQSRRLSGLSFLPRLSLTHASESINKARCLTMSACSSLPISVK